MEDTSLSPLSVEAWHRVPEAGPRSNPWVTPCVSEDVIVVLVAYDGSRVVCRGARVFLGIEANCAVRDLVWYFERELWVEDRSVISLCRWMYQRLSEGSMPEDGKGYMEELTWTISRRV